MTVLRSLDEFEAVRAQWDDLWSRSPEASAFQSHAWTVSWARQHVAPGRLAVVLVWEAGVLIAGTAMHLERRGPLVALTPVGGAISDVTDVLVDPGAPDALPRLTQALLDTRGWGCVDLPELPPASAALGLVDLWPGRAWTAPASLSLDLPALPVDELLARLPSRTAGTLRRKIRKIAALGVERTEVTDVADVPRAVDDLVLLHRQQWAGRGGNPEHLTRRFRDHLVASLERLVPAGVGVLAEYRLGGELLASQIDFVDERSVSYYLAGVSPLLRGQVDTAVLLASSDLELARLRAVARYSMLRGREDYKLRWRPEEQWASRLVLTRPRALRGVVHLSAVRARHDLVRRARPVLRAARGRWATLAEGSLVAALRAARTPGGSA